VVLPHPAHSNRCEMLSQRTSLYAWKT
jgi:hypothetical protein